MVEMTEATRLHRLEKRTRIIQVLFIGAVVSAAVLFLGGLVGAGTERFATIEVERIDLVEADGRPALVIANSDRAPGPYLRGEELPRDVSAGRGTAPGVWFFNSEGTEAGGLTYSGHQGDGERLGSSSLKFDRVNQDQVMALEYVEVPGVLATGLRIWDQPDWHIEQHIDPYLRFQEGELSEADFQTEVAELAPAHTDRMLVATLNRSALIRLHDTEGRPRIRLVVDSLDNAYMEFLDEEGEIVMRLP